MAAKSHWFEGQLLNHIFRTTAFAQPGNLYLALFTAAPSDDFVSGTPTGTEVTGGSYARALVGTLDADWTYTAGNGATAGKVVNTNAITFSPNPTAGWGVVTHFAIVDAASGNCNLLYWAALTASKTINSGDTVSFAAGALSISED
jgi:hypothetical protein